MSVTSFERELVWEANSLLKIHRLKLKDLQEWSSAPIEKRNDETVIYSQVYKMFLAFKTETLTKYKAVFPVQGDIS